MQYAFGTERKHGSVTKTLFCTVEEAEYTYCVSISGRCRQNLLLKFQSGSENVVHVCKSILKFFLNLSVSWI